MRASRIQIVASCSAVERCQQPIEAALEQTRREQVVHRHEAPACVRTGERARRACWRRSSGSSCAVSAPPNSAVTARSTSRRSPTPAARSAAAAHGRCSGDSRPAAKPGSRRASSCRTATARAPPRASAQGDQGPTDARAHRLLGAARQHRGIDPLGQGPAAARVAQRAVFDQMLRQIHARARIAARELVDRLGQHAEVGHGSEYRRKQRLGLRASQRRQAKLRRSGWRPRAWRRARSPQRRPPRSR